MMEDRRYERDSFPSRSRLRERDYSPDYRYLPRGTDIDSVTEFRVMDDRGGNEFERINVDDRVMRGGGEFDRVRVDDRRYRSGGGRDCRGDRGGREFDGGRVDDRVIDGGVEFDSVRVDDRNFFPGGGRDCRGDRGGNEFENVRVDDRVMDGGGEFDRVRVDDREYCSGGGRGCRADRGGREFERVRVDNRVMDGGVEYERVRVGDRRYSPVVGRDGSREFDSGRVDDRVMDGGREFDRVRVGNRRYSPVAGRDGSREFDSVGVGDQRYSPMVGRDCRDDRGGREFERIRRISDDEGRYSPVVGRDGSREFDSVRVGDRRYAPVVGRDGREDQGGREFKRIRVDDRVMDGRGEYERVGAGDRRYSLEDRGGREFERIRVSDRRYSPVSMVGRDRRKDLDGGREYDRRRCSVGREVEGVRDGGEYDSMRVNDRGRSSLGRVVEGIRDGMEDRDDDRSSSAGMRVVEGIRDGKEDCDGSDDRRSFAGRREVEGVRDGREECSFGGRECDRMRVDNRGCSPRGREVEVGRDGREYQKGGFDDGKYSMGASWSAGQHDRHIIDHVYSRDQRELKETCIGDEYEERIADCKYSLIRREIEGMQNGQGSRMLGQESPIPVAENGRMDERIREQVRLRRDYDTTVPDAANRLRDYDRVPPDIADRGRDCDRAPPDVANRGRDCDRAPPSVANRGEDCDRAPLGVTNRGGDCDRAPPDNANRGRDCDRAPPSVANRGGDCDRAPLGVTNRGGDCDRAPPDNANRARDDDGALPWSMILPRDDRHIEKDNSNNNNGLLERNCYQFDDGLSGMGTTSLKLQNNLLDERWKPDTFRSNREFGVSDARLCNDGDNFSKQSLNVGLLERFRDPDLVLLNSDNGNRFASSCPSDSIIFSEDFGVASRGHLLPPHLDNTDHKHVDLHGDCYLNKLTGDRPYTEDRNTLKLSEDEYDYIPSSSLSKAFSPMSSGGYGEEFPPLVKETDKIGSGGAVLSCGISGKPLMYDEHGQKSPFRYSIVHGTQSNENRCYARSYVTMPEEHKSSAHQEVGRSEDSRICSGSCDISANSRNLVQNDCWQDRTRTHDLELNMDREKYQFSKLDRSSDGSQQWDLDPYSIQHCMPDYVNAIRSSHLKKQDMGILDFGDSRLQYDVRTHDDLGPNQHSEYHDSRKDDGSHCHHDRSEMMRSGKHYPNLDGRDHSPTQKLFLHNLNSSQSSEMMLQHRHLARNLQNAHQTNGEIYVKEPYGDDELDFFSVSKKSEYRSCRYEKTGSGCRDLSTELTNRNCSQPLTTVVTNDTRSSGRDIKSRLGPSPQNAPASGSVAKKLKSSVKNRLGNGPKNNVTLPWIKNLSAPKLSTIHTDSEENHDRGDNIMEGHGSSRRLDPNSKVPKLSRIRHDSHGNIAQAGNTLEANKIFGIGEPLEDSEEFKQLVHSHFFKFIKHLNETLVRRRKFMENGKCGSLKCLVCGSDSPEFQDTESLVMHALSCDKIFSKCQHLGFHKALCTLMGWRSVNVLNDSWVCEKLSDAETSALKEDLLIWPPVVVVHNITIADIPEKRIMLSGEEFKGKLRDMGFGDKTNVTLGRPANQGAMVVSFGPTFSAFPEAERLHKIFLNFNRGRTGLLQLDSNISENNTGESPVASEDELHPFLYGYIGLAGDLDKLDFEIKRRSQIKSKMEVQVIEDALVKNEVAADATNKKEAITETMVN